MTALFYTFYASPLGKLLMLSDGENLLSVDFELEQYQPNMDWVEKKDLPLFQQVCMAFDRYFQGLPESFKGIPLAPKGTPFQQSIWKALCNINYGETSTYGELARLIENPKAIRAVGGAVGRNPISIIIPCHRILGKDRSLTGFGGGLPAKRFLLELENITFIDKGVEFVKPKFLKRYQ
ncbi:methylated-DNA--[protein]-cysteine S-methyltransferase [Rodentibacter caecimuris]|uniref:Methylated-DNA--protein-cysteine methyltransferase n=1 Tax=Rodentibacter caecimuris TaxID=1796644 RepID=A0ABX3KXF1_9PAST|nr:cysteine methyltransferase [Rodentibacter heylii]